MEECLLLAVMGAVMLSVGNFDLSDMIDLVFFVSVCIGTAVSAWCTGIEIGKRIYRLAKRKKPRR